MGGGGGDSSQSDVPPVILFVWLILQNERLNKEIQRMRESVCGMLGVCVCVCV